MLRRPLRAALAAAALALLACRAGRGGPPPERFVPAAVRAAVLVPDARRAASELAALHASVSAFPGAGELAAAGDGLAAQLGFDPLDPEALAGAGIDPRRGAAVALLAGSAAPGAVLVVLPVGDAAAIESLLARLARDRLGAVQRSSEPRGGVSPIVFRRPGSAAPALTYAIVERTAILTTHPAGPEVVAAAAALAPDASLASNPAWKAARGALAGAGAVLAFAPAGSPLLEGAWPLADGVALALSAGEARLLARAAVLLGTREPSFRALAAEGAPGKAPPLDPGAHLVARWHGDPGALGRKLAWALPPRERALLAGRGVDPQRDLLELLAPGAAVALSLAPALDVAGLTSAALRADPLGALEFEAVLPVKDLRAAEALSARLAGGVLPARSGDVQRLRTPSGEIAWTIDAGAGRILAAGGKPGKLDALAARAAREGGYRAPTEAARTALSGGLGGAVLDAPRLVAAIRRLPPEAFGTGPSGFLVRSLVERVVEPAARLAAVSLRADLAPGALVLTLEVETPGGGGER